MPNASSVPAMKSEGKASTKRASSPSNDAEASINPDAAEAWKSAPAWLPYGPSGPIAEISPTMMRGFSALSDL